MARRSWVRIVTGAGLLISASLAGLLVSALIWWRPVSAGSASLAIDECREWTYAGGGGPLDRKGALVASACLRNGEMGILPPGKSATCTEFLAVPRADLDRVGRIVLRVTRAEVYRVSGGMA